VSRPAMVTRRGSEIHDQDRRRQLPHSCGGTPLRLTRDQSRAMVRLQTGRRSQNQWPLHKISALDDLKAECLRRGLWREEGNHIRRGPFPPPVPEVPIRELSVQEEGDGHTFLKIEPLHAPSVVYETGDSDPTTSSSPVPTPARFEATGMRYRFLSFDPTDLGRVNEVKEWTAKLRLKYQLQNRGDHYEVELLALPKANGIAIRYTTDGSSPTSTAFATYDGPFRVPANCRVVCAMAVSSGYDVSSETIRIPIPRKGEEERTLDLAIPARWNHQTKLDDSGAVWDFIKRLETAAGVCAYDISLTAESSDGLQKGIGWRKALRAAIADNPFVKGEGLSPKARRELLAIPN
jgi:hypothetical protein